MRQILGFFLAAVCCGGTQIRELAQIEGVRDNQLVGYGIVVGLNGTGDKRQTLFSAQSLASLIQRFQVNVPAAAIQVKNTASVLVTATLPPFGQPGTRIDVSVAAIGDCSSLRGGILIMTPLRAANGQVYGAAQGPLTVGGFAVAALGTSQTVNHPTTARIPSGAIVEQAGNSVMPSGEVRLQLKQADFSTAVAIAKVVNDRFPDKVASAVNPASVQVKVPEEYQGRVAEFIAVIESLEAKAGRRKRIVVNERTGTIAIGADVTIRPTSILHGGLTIQIRTEFEVSQPAPFGRGDTTVVPRTDVAVTEEKAKSVELQEGATVRDLVKALTQIGATARDIVAILESLRVAGAFDAELEVI